MNRWLLFFLLVFLGISSAFAETDVFGFQNFTWGMTGEQIKGAAPDKVVKLKKRLLNSDDKNSYVEHAIFNYPVGAMKFNVTFNMDPVTQKLRSVNLTKNGSSKVDPLDFELLLVKKYGEPNHRLALQSYNGRDVRWVFKTTRIRFHSLTIGEDTSLNILYESVAASGMGNL